MCVLICHREFSGCAHTRRQKTQRVFSQGYMSMGHVIHRGPVRYITSKTHTERVEAGVLLCTVGNEHTNTNSGKKRRRRNYRETYISYSMKHPKWETSATQKSQHKRRIFSAEFPNGHKNTKWDRTRNTFVYRNTDKTPLTLDSWKSQ